MSHQFRSLLKAGAAVSLLLSTMAANAVDVQWLRFSPARFFNDKDWELASQTADKVLGEMPDGEVVSWNNPDNGHHGEMSARSIDDLDGHPCRMLQIVNHAAGRSGSSSFRFCRQDDGSWKVPPSDGVEVPH